MAKVVIGGGTGFVGRHLKKLLTDNGHKVVVVSRQAGRDRTTWNDLDRNGLPEDTTAVINLAGDNILNPMKRWTPEFMEAVRSSRVDTTKKLASYIAQAKTPPKVFATISGVAGYEPSPMAEYTESSPVKEFDFLSKLAIDWEAAAQLPENVNVRQFIVRSGVVLGGDGGMIQQLYIPFKLGLGGRIGSGTQWMPWIHVSDLAGIFHHGITNDSVSGILNGVAPQAVTNAEFAGAFAKSMSRPAFIPLPGFVMNIMYGSERGKVVLEGQKVIPERTLELGYSYKYPDIDSACKAAADGFSFTSQS